MSHDPTAAGALDQLVHQFSDPLSFYRELIQNSIDAGSTEVEVLLEHADGVITIHVDDWGEGMNREIIDTRLTRLFSSRKDGDLTQIGKFGIGFVSVFAIEPDAVVVDTGRDDESWRVLFHRDRSFERIVRDRPVEGTKIRILKRGDRSDYDQLLWKTVEVICFWCRYVEVEVRIQGKPINRPFALDSPCQVAWSEPGTRIVVGYPADGTPRFGFYNRGLTLSEGPASGDQRASVLVDSRFLEHTLARDGVRQDEAYFELMATVDRLLRDDLPRQLATELERAAAAGAAGERVELLHRFLAAAFETHPPAAAGEPPTAFRHLALFRSPGGTPRTVAEVAQALRRRRLLSAAAASELVDALEAEGWLVIEAVPNTARWRLLAAMAGGPPATADRRFCKPAPAAADEPGWPTLHRELLALLRRLGVKVRDVVLGRLGGGSRLGDWVAVAQRRPFALSEIDDLHRLGHGLFSASRTLVVNAEHPNVRRLLALAAAEPQLAAYLLVKRFLLRSGLDAATDGRIARAAWERRCRSSG